MSARIRPSELGGRILRDPMRDEASGQAGRENDGCGRPGKQASNSIPESKFAGHEPCLGDRTPAMYYRPGRISDVPKYRIEHTGPVEPHHWPR